MSIDFLSILNPTPKKKKKNKGIDFLSIVGPEPTPQPRPQPKQKEELKPNITFDDIASSSLAEKTSNSTPSTILPTNQHITRDTKDIPATIGAPKPAPFKQPDVSKSQTEQEAIADAMKAWEEGTLPADINRRKELAKITIPRISRNLRVGFQGSAASTVRGAEWLAPKFLKPVLADVAKDYESNIEILAVENPTFMDSLTQGAASSALFFVPGVGVSKGLQAVGMVGKWGVRAGLSLTTSLESMAEAGGVYKTSLDRGLSEEEASKKAGQTFWANMAVIGITNKYGIFSDKITNKLFRALASSPLEGVQEGLQQIIQNFENDRDLMEGVGESALIGAILGVPLGLVGGAQITPDVVRRAIEDNLGELPPAPPSPLVSFTAQDEQTREQWRVDAVDKAIENHRKVTGTTKETTPVKGAKKPLIDFKAMTGETVEKVGNEEKAAIERYVTFNHRDLMTAEVVESISNLNIKPTEAVTLYRDGDIDNTKFQSWSVNPKIGENPTKRVFQPDEIVIDLNNPEASNLFSKVGKESLERYNKLEGEMIVKAKEIGPDKSLTRKIQEAEAQVTEEFVTSEAGERIPQGSDEAPIIQKSTFPSWVPSNLRKKPLLNAVREHIINGTIPTKAEEKRLFDIAQLEIAERAGVKKTKPKKGEKDPTKDINVSKVQFERIAPNKSESKAGVNSNQYYASKGEFSNIKIPDHVTHIEMPELIKLTKGLLDGAVPFIKKFPSAWGMFYADPTNPRIALNPKVFEQEGQAVKTLAHEIGHLIDFLPESNIKRGNLLNRLESLVNIRKGIFGDEELIKQRKNLMNAINKLNNTEKTRSLTVGEATRRDTKVELFNQINEKLVFDKEMRDELKALSQFWKPFEPGDNPNFTAYRYSSPELYADFISVLFNRPDLAMTKAPKFHKRFFEYIESKPEVKKQYFELMDFLTGKREDILDAREADIRKSFQTATELEIQRMSEGIGKSMKERVSSAAKSINKALIEKNIALIEKVEEVIKSGKKIAPEKNPAVLLEELDMVKNEVSNVFDNVGEIDARLSESKLTDDDFSTYLFYKRITGDRATFANPFGATKESSNEGLKRMKEKLGKERFSVLEKEAITFNEIYNKEMELGVEDGLYSQELFDELTKGDDIYATFKILDYVLSGSVSSSIMGQIGTFKDIGQTYQATIAKMVAIRVAAHKNNFKKVSGEFFLENFSQEEAINIEIPDVKKAEILGAKIDPRTGGAPTTTRNKAGDTLELITWRDEGKLKGVYIDPEIASSYKTKTNVNNELIRETIGFVNNELFRKAYIDYSIRFIVRNPIRDLSQAWTALKVTDLQGTGPMKVTFREFVSSIKNSFPEARAFARGEKTETVNKILDSKIMGVDEDFKMTEKDLDESTALSREMRKRGLRLDQIKQDKTSKNPLVHFGNFVMQVGKTSEAITKIMAYQLIEEKLNLRDSKVDKSTAKFIRNNIGTPNWRKGGTMTPNTNVLFMFSNVAFQGYKRTFGRSGLIQDPKTRSGFLWRTAEISILPKLLMWMAAAGLMGDQLKKLYDRESEYKKRNYLILPLGTHNDKTVSITLPMDYTGRLVTAIMWTALNSIKDKDLSGSGVWNVLSAEMPGLTNTIAIPLKWGEYFRGINPRDNWRGRNILTDNEFKSGGFTALEPMLRWTWNQIFGGIVKVKARDSIRKETMFEKTAKIGGINAFLSVSDYGLQESIMKDQKVVEKRKAKESIAKTENIIDHLRKFYKSGDSEEDIEKYIKMARRVEFEGKTFTMTEANAYTKSFMRESLKSYNSAPITSLIYSNTIEEQKIAIKKIKKYADKDDFNKIRALFLNSRIISRKTWGEAENEIRRTEAQE